MFDEEVDVVDVIKKFAINVYKGTIEIKDSLEEIEELVLAREFVGEALGELNKFKKIFEKTKDIPSNLFYKKLEGFLKGISKIDKKKREKFFNDFEEELSKDSERILNLINKVDNGKKIDYIVILFIRLVNEEIDFNMFFRLTNVIERCHFEDLEVFLNETYYLRATKTRKLDLLIDDFLNLGLIYDKRYKDLFKETDLGQNRFSQLKEPNKYIYPPYYALEELGEELKKQLNSEVNYE